MDRKSSRSASDPEVPDGTLAAGGLARASGAPRGIAGLPKEFGVLLMTAGITTGMLPPPPGPFDMMIILTGVIEFWPRGLRGVEGWDQRRFPKAHRGGMKFLDRLLADLERRYPNPLTAQTPLRDPGSGPPGCPPG